MTTHQIDTTSQTEIIQSVTLVGETTGGGAHPGSPFRLHPHFEVFIPLGRAINPITNDI